jgi:hypothetical protein
MATITSTIKLATTTLFPTPVNFTLPVTETVALDAAFSTVVVEADDSAIIYDPAAAVGSSNVVYVYLQSPSTNPAAGITVSIQDSGSFNSTAMKLIPGDFAWFPLLADGASVKVTLNNLDQSNTATVNYFYGEKG